MKKIKNYINSYRDIGNWKSGWFWGLPQHFLAGDKQQHALLGSWFLVVYVFLIVESEFSKLLSFGVAFIAAAIVGYIWEVIQKKRKSGVYDHRDVVSTNLGFTIFVLLTEFIRLFTT